MNRVTLPTAELRRKRLAMSLASDVKDALKKAVEDLWNRVERLVAHIPEGIDDEDQLAWTAQDVAVDMLEADLEEENFTEPAYALADWSIHEYGRPLIEEIVTRYKACAASVVAPQLRTAGFDKHELPASRAVLQKLRDAVDDVEISLDDVASDCAETLKAFRHGTAHWTDDEIDEECNWLVEQVKSELPNIDLNQCLVALTKDLQAWNKLVRQVRDEQK